MVQIFQPTERTVNPEPYRKILKILKKPDTVNWVTPADGNLTLPPITLKNNEASDWDEASWPSIECVARTSQINQTKAMSQYLLEREDLQDLCYVVGDKIGPTYNAPHLYLSSQVLRRAWEKHGGPRGLKYVMDAKLAKKKEMASSPKKKKAIDSTVGHNPPAAASGSRLEAAAAAVKKEAKPKSITKPTPGKLVGVAVASPPLTPQRFPLEVDDYSSDVDMKYRKSSANQGVAGPSRIPRTPATPLQHPTPSKPPTTSRRAGKADTRNIDTKDELSESVIDLTITDNNTEDEKTLPKLRRLPSSHRAQEKIRHMDVIDISD